MINSVHVPVFIFSTTWDNFHHTPIYLQNYMYTLKIRLSCKSFAFKLVSKIYNPKSSKISWQQNNLIFNTTQSPYYNITPLHNYHWTYTKYIWYINWTHNGHPPPLSRASLLCSVGGSPSSGRRGRSPHSHIVLSSSDKMDRSTWPCLWRSTSVSLLGEGGRVLVGLKQEFHWCRLVLVMV